MVQKCIGMAYCETSGVSAINAILGENQGQLTMIIWCGFWLAGSPTCSQSEAA